MLNITYFYAISSRGLPVDFNLYVRFVPYSFGIGISCAGDLSEYILDLDTDGLYRFQILSKNFNTDRRLNPSG